jgi:hypothetical protein
MRRPIEPRGLTDYPAAAVDRSQSALKLNRRERLKWAGLILWSGLLILIVYGSALNLPFMADDYFHLPYVDQHTIVQMWQTADGLYYFRPLSFTIWKLMEPLFGYHNLIAQHALNLLLHLSNALMVAWLAGQLWSTSGRGDWRRVASATLFVLYPFSYEAVPWIGSLVHPLVTFLILASVVSYAKMRATGKWRWGLISLMFTLLSPFAHENGALVVPLIVLVEVTDPIPIESLWRRLRRVAVWLVPLLIWLVIWRSIPVAHGANNLTFNKPNTIVHNILYFAQGAAYPLTWTGGWLRDTVGVKDFLAAIILSAVALVIAALLQWRTRSNRRGLLPWSWIATASLPALFFLDYLYLSAAPRTMMLSSVGVVWLWTDVVVRLADWGRSTMTRQRVSVALAAVTCGAVLIQNYIFIQGQMRVFQMSGAVIRQAVQDTVAANDVGQAATFINLPVWIAPPQVNYAIGQEGVVLGPAPDQLDKMITVHTGQPANIKAVRFDAIRQAVPYYVGLLSATSDWSGLTHTGGQVFFTRYTTETIVIDPVGALGEPKPSTQPMARFDDNISLLDAAATMTASGLQVSFLWQVNEPPPDDVTIFVHILDANGQLIAQADGDPLAGSYPFSQWPKDSTVRDVRSIDAKGSGLSVQAGVYNRASGERLKATSGEGASFADNAVPIVVH